MPTDLLALVAHGSTSHFENQAWPRERLGTRDTQPTLSVLRDQLLAFSKQRTAWVCAERQKLHGLVGARHRGSAAAWEIDYLVDCDSDDAVPAELLARVVQAAGARRAEKLFLRLSAESPLLQVAHEAGFLPFQEETLYTCTQGMQATPAEMRRATTADSYPLFRLYTAATPEVTRRAEAATYSEWQASIERRWMRNGVELLAESNSEIQASARAARLPQGVMLELTLSTESANEAPELIAAVTREMQATSELLLTLVPSTSQELARQLEDAGFSVQGEYVSLVHRTTRPLSLPEAVPAVARNVVGA